MENNNYSRRTCRLCASPNLIIVLKLNPTPLADDYITKSFLKNIQPSYPLNLALCKNCGHVQLQEVIHPQAIYVNYIYETISSLGLVEHFNAYAKQVVKQVKPAKNSLVVDIGSNDGTLLKGFKKNGLRVLGIDPARKIAKLANQDGIETLPIFFTKKQAIAIRKKYGPASLVTANNIYANIDDLDDFTQGVKALLSPAGVFIIESFYLLDLLRKMVFDFIYHEHLSYFYVKPLIHFFSKHGMELIDVLPITTKGGSLRYTIQLAGGPKKIKPSVNRQILLETKAGLGIIQTYKTFEKRILSAKSNLLGLLAQLNKQKKTIVGFGASATSTTLLSHFELNDKLDYLLDDYPKKQNTYSPGAHLQVLQSHIIYERKPDYVLILAWRYFQPIIQKNKKFLRQGGHFIIPLPKLVVI